MGTIMWTAGWTLGHRSLQLAAASTQQTVPAVGLTSERGRDGRIGRICILSITHTETKESGTISWAARHRTGTSLLSVWTVPTMRCGASWSAITVGIAPLLLETAQDRRRLIALIASSFVLFRPSKQRYCLARLVPHSSNAKHHALVMVCCAS